MDDTRAANILTLHQSAATTTNEASDAARNARPVRAGSAARLSPAATSPGIRMPFHSSPIGDP
ncbi:hypothetical protein, partial [Kitasatospora sp. MBT63]|uniref:hypothetical protein n=1 Tax=Kitasatospora sp. MBT63 TaxID=1444768 RepID=UPI0019D6B7A5